MSWDRFKEINSILKVYSDCSLKTLDQKQNDAKGFLDHPGPLLLQGECGTGKTYFMFTLIREIFETKKRHISEVLFMRAKNLSDKMEEEFKKYGSTHGVIERVVEAPYLFIDDFGVQGKGDRMERDFYEIVDVRMGNMQPTVFSTNLTDEEIRDTFGARIHSRLKVCEKLLFNGEDRRSYF